MSEFSGMTNVIPVKRVKIPHLRIREDLNWVASDSDNGNTVLFRNKPVFNGCWFAPGGMVVMNIIELDFGDAPNSLHRIERDEDGSITLVKDWGCCALPDLPIDHPVFVGLNPDDVVNGKIPRHFAGWSEDRRAILVFGYGCTSFTAEDQLDYPYWQVA